MKCDPLRHKNPTGPRRFCCSAHVSDVYVSQGRSRLVQEAAGVVILSLCTLFLTFVHPGNTSAEHAGFVLTTVQNLSASSWKHDA